MRRRDIVVVLFCIGAVVLASVNEAPVTLHGAFRIPFAADNSGRLPPQPILADLNGDGIVELLAVNPSDTLGAYATTTLRTWGDHSHFSEIKPILKSMHSSNIIAFTVGPLDRLNESDSYAIAVVTDDYRVEVLSGHKMAELWSASVIGEAAATAILPTYATVTIASERIFINDMGAVIVAMPIADDQHIIACFDGATGDLRWRKVERANFDGASNAEQRKAYDVDAYKFTAGDIETEPPQLYTAINTFPNLLHLALPHSSEHPWRTHMAPAHLYTKKSKKKRVLMNSAGSSGSSSSSGGGGGGRKRKDRRVSDPEAAENDHSASSQNQHGKVQGGDDLGDDLGRKLAQASAQRIAQRKPRRDNNVVVIHLPSHVLVLHYYSGKTLAVLDALKKGALYEDLDNDGTIDEVTLNMGGTVQHQFSRHGFEENARCSATVRHNWPDGDEPVEIPLCGHSDAGLLERLSVPFTVRESSSKAHTMGDQSRLHGYAGEHGENKQDISSTMPVVLHGVQNSLLSPQQTKKGRTSQSRVLFLLSTGELAIVHGRQTVHGVINQEEVQQIDEQNRRENTMRRFGMAPSFASSQQAPVAEARPWVIPTPSEFANSPLSHESETSGDRFGLVDTAMRPHPHVVPYTFHTTPAASGEPMRYPSSGYGAQHAIAVGDSYITMVNAHAATIMCTAKLESEPTGPSVVVDFSGDGVSDVIVPTMNGYFGYVVRRHAATSAVGTVMAVVFSLFAVLVAARLVESGAAAEVLLLPGATFGMAAGAAVGGDGVSSAGAASSGGEISEQISQRLRSGKRSTD